MPTWQDPNDELDPNDEFDPVEDPDEPADTLPCPSCRRQVYEDTVRCPHCGCYITPDLASSRRTWWFIAAALLALLATLIWILG